EDSVDMRIVERVQVQAAPRQRRRVVYRPRLASLVEALAMTLGEGDAGTRQLFEPNRARDPRNNALHRYPPPWLTGDMGRGGAVKKKNMLFFFAKCAKKACQGGTPGPPLLALALTRWLSANTPGSRQHSGLNSMSPPFSPAC